MRAGIGGSGGGGVSMRDLGKASERAQQVCLRAAASATASFLQPPTLACSRCVSRSRQGSARCLPQMPSVLLVCDDERVPPSNSFALHEAAAAPMQSRSRWRRELPVVYAKIARWLSLGGRHCRLRRCRTDFGQCEAERAQRAVVCACATASATASFL